jgi:mono/diheme cytochrome c family protein
MQRAFPALLAAGLTLLASVMHARQQAPATAGVLPPPATHTVDFAQEVAPLLLRSCARCHARGQSKGRFSLETREKLLAGGRDGPAIVVGNSADSLLIQLVSGLDPDRPMPEKGARLTPAEIGVLRAWIDQGATWDDAVTFARREPQNLVPRRPDLPPPHGELVHPIDRLLAAHERSAAADAPRASDRALARRLSLDLVGLLPAPADVEAFVADTRPDKVERFAARLLADRHAYAAHWLTFWNDLLRNDYRGPGYIDGGRRQITSWLYTALATNLAFDEFVATLVAPGPDSEGFTKGIIWRGVVNASQTPPLQAAQNVSQVFMGVNLKCASCHDSFINDWQLADAYGLAGVYADEPLEMVECDRPTGTTAPLKFLYPSLGTIDADASREERVKALAALMVAERNGRLSRTIVNRLWARLFGRGLVEPLDDMDRAAWHPDLLDWLAEDLVAHEYDLQHTLLRIVSSQAYQREAVSLDLDAPVTAATASADPRFEGPAVRRLTAEQFVDAIGSIAGAWATLPEGDFGPDVAEGREVPQVPTSWFWRADRAEPAAGRRPADPTLVLRTTVRLDRPVTAAALLAVVPQALSLDVNDTRVTTIRPGGPRLVDLGTRLEPGTSTLTLSGVAPAPASDAKPEMESGHGMLALLYLREPGLDGELRVVPLEAARWEWTAGDGGTSWQPAAPSRSPSPDRHANAASGAAFERAFARAALTGRTRAALTTASPLTTALGRPNREQVVTVRTETPTTLQALELANGETLAQLLRRGAEALRGESGATPDAIVERIYTRALSRPPAAKERALALDLLGPSPGVEAVEDLLWTVTMLPEFRLVH